jgi:hypothetical protein
MISEPNDDFKHVFPSGSPRKVCGGATALSDAVRVTLGCGRNVLIERSGGGHGLQR